MIQRLPILLCLLLSLSSCVATGESGAEWDRHRERRNDQLSNSLQWMQDTLVGGERMKQSIDSLGIDPAEDARRTGENARDLLQWPVDEVREGSAQLADDFRQIEDRTRQDLQSLPDKMLLFWLHLY